MRRSVRSLALAQVVLVLAACSAVPGDELDALVVARADFHPVGAFVGRRFGAATVGRAERVRAR